MRVQGEKGFSLIEVLVGAGILSVILLALASINIQLRSMVAKGASATEVDIFQRNLMSLIRDDGAWAKTVAADSVLRNCLQFGAVTAQPTPPPICRLYCAFWGAYPGCHCSTDKTRAQEDVGKAPDWATMLGQDGGKGTDGSGGGQYPQQPASGCPVGASNAKSLVVYDGAGNPYYNPTIGNTGINSVGAKCDTYPDPKCPMRFEVKWYMTAGTPYPVVGIIGEFKTDPSLLGQSFNTDRYNIPIVYRPAR